MRGKWITLLKIGVTVVGLVVVVTKFDLGVMGETLAQARLGWVLLAFVLVIVSLVVRAFRWWLLLRGLGASIGLWRLVELYFVGNFYNAFLPSGFGGDVVRVVEVSQDVEAGVAAGTVLVDRLTGLLVLFVLALLALPFRPANFPPTLLWPIVGLCVVGLAAGGVILQGDLALTVVGWLPLWLEGRVMGFVRPMLTAVRQCGRQAIGQALAVSAFFTLFMVGWWFAAAKALGFIIPLSYLLLVIPILSISLLVPSIGGLGVRETLAPLLFAGVNLSPAQAASMALVVFAVERLSGLLGAPIYIASLLRRRQGQ